MGPEILIRVLSAWQMTVACAFLLLLLPVVHALASRAPAGARRGRRRLAPGRAARGRATAPRRNRNPVAVQATEEE